VARFSLADHLQNFPFQLIDVAPTSPTALPVFLPGSSFSSVTSPELSLEMHEIPEGNALFPKNVVKRATLSPITLMRGATAYDSDFYRWIMVALAGRPRLFSLGNRIQIGGPTARRTLLLIHFFRHSPLPRFATGLAAGAALTAVGSAANGGIDAPGSSTVGTTVFGGVAAGIAGAGIGATAAAIDAATGAPYSQAIRLPARAWLLQGCLPTRYKAGTDFDASSGDVSVMELELTIEGFQEFALGTAPIP
jgi:hypothetical protein